MDFAIDTYVNFLNHRSSKKPVASEIADLYDPTEQKRSVAYASANYRVSLVGTSLSFLLMILALTFNWFAKLDLYVRQRVEGEILVSLAFIGALVLISNLISLPFGIYSTFKVEAEFGFNKSTPITFITDLIKGLGLTIVIGGGLLTLVLWLYQELTATFWIWAWLLFAGFSLFIFMFATKIFLPLFNKLTPN